MLAGRKLLLADDSITIQKVVALTFADEGIEVLAVSNGADAVEVLEEFAPDVVLADVYMPKMTGLQVCDYIKRNDKLKHIPVMLLVGSFEPFEEAEARRVGADDTLTKPFQSIRTLLGRVGVLLGRDSAPASSAQSAAAVESESDGLDVAPEIAGSLALDGARTLDGAETLEFPNVDETPQREMDSDELALVTADTRELATEIPQPLKPLANEDRGIELAAKEQKMETHLTSDAGLEFTEGPGDNLLDLSHFQGAPARSQESAEDIILDVDFDSPAPELFYSAPADISPAAVAVASPPLLSTAADDVVLTTQAEEVIEWDGDIHTGDSDWGRPAPVQEAVASEKTTGELTSPFPSAAIEVEESALPLEPVLATAPPAETAAATTGQISLEQLSPAAIDAIARRVLEQLSEKAVQEIAWEVVPQLAELLIKQKLEESK